MSKRKPTESPYRFWEADTKAYDLPALKLGETSRKCERCGGEYIPNARTQKCCYECRRRKNERRIL